MCFGCVRARVLCWVCWVGGSGTDSSEMKLGIAAGLMMYAPKDGRRRGICSHLSTYSTYGIDTVGL